MAAAAGRVRAGQCGRAAARPGPNQTLEQTGRAPGACKPHAPAARPAAQLSRSAKGSEAATLCDMTRTPDKRRTLEPGFFLAREKQKLGPLSLGQLQEMAGSGRLGPGDMILPPGSGKWVPAASFSALFPAPVSAAAATGPRTEESPHPLGSATRRPTSARRWRFPRRIAMPWVGGGRSIPRAQGCTSSASALLPFSR